MAAHVAAHAVRGCNFKVAKPTILAKEYIACVAMCSVMSPELSAETYRHFPGQGDKTQVLLDILDGKAPRD